MTLRRSFLERVSAVMVLWMATRRQAARMAVERRR